MPAQSEDQRQAAGAALAAKRGEKPVSSLKGASKQMFDSMSEAQLRDFAKRPRTTREAMGMGSRTHKASKTSGSKTKAHKGRPTSSKTRATHSPRRR